MDVKLCPGCGAEYYAHVSDCADCGVPLVDPNSGELAGPDAELGGPTVAIRESSISQLKEFREVLEGSGIASCISASPGCKSGGCGTSSLLMVAEAHVVAANTRLEQHYLECHPEAAILPAEHDEHACPACGFEAAPDTRECPDCGLALALD